MENWVIYILNGLYFASFLFLTSLGLSIILGVMGILNLAHGSLFAIGAFVAAWIVGAFGSNSPITLFFVGLLAALGVAGVVGLALETSLIRPMYKRALEYQLLITFGALLLIEDLIKMIWGGTAYYASKPFTVMGSLSIGDNQYPYYFLLAMVISMLAGLSIWLIMSKTRVGIMLRSISMDREMAQAMGIGGLGRGPHRADNTGTSRYRHGSPYPGLHCSCFGWFGKSKRGSCGIAHRR